MKRIVICADGTWNKPEEDLKDDMPSNVLKLARAIKPIGRDKVPQQVFYDWGVGSYYSKVVGGVTGHGLHKNIMDDYRYIVQNYSPGDEIYLFGFSRGAYTVRSLCGMINNVGIIKRPDANLIQAAFNHYKKPGKLHSVEGPKSVEFRKKHSHISRNIKFVGVWDTVGAMGIPFSVMGLFDKKDEFYDTKMGRNIKIARHALAIDEFRKDFDATIWKDRENMDMKQVWFAGAHSDLGGGYKPDSKGYLLSDIALDWMIREASNNGLTVEPHLKKRIKKSFIAKIHKSRRNFYYIKKAHYRKISKKKFNVLIHESVKKRYESDNKYRPNNLVDFLEENKGWPSTLEK